ncbi:MAG: PSD1 and planctomycete cytochrome C domain-containing protein [Fuerstiella sp.]|nr:PSD1 and planctomycete cytochrome C domain-containing protein [Fuerstiella sp.]
MTFRLLTVALTIFPIAATHADEREVFFERQIRPLLVEKCVGCHGSDKQEGDIRLDSRDQVLTGTDEVAALVDPEQVDESRLLQVVLYSEDDVQMPPKAKLAPPEIQAVRKWIRDGAYWPETMDFGKAKAINPDAWKKHWAFQPIANPEPPSETGSSTHPVDAFVRRRLQEAETSPSPQADGRTLVRRLSISITGLPPSAKDLQEAAALSDPTQLNTWLDAYADRLLATPQFGERWARYWLDVSRYADTKGYVFTENREYKEAWRFREWVIKSLNSDMPYDEFLIRQLAGDRMPENEDPQQLAAMGFLTLGRRFLNNRHDIIDDRIDVVSRGTMGLTVTCARCHDHKFDPIPTADYYSLYGVFDSSHEPGNAPSSLRLVDHAKPREPVIFIRGSAGNRGDRVPRHFLTALSKGEPEPFTDGSGRLELAKKIASPENPLTARVAVNRIWLRLFGNGLVDSPSDFGVRTPPPSHPELLDHLAKFLINHNWSRKSVIRHILTSQTWRQSSAPRPDVADADPENRLLARMSRRRLNFEAFRDALLTVSGNLDQTVGGASVDITTRPFTKRRAVYARIDRQNLPGTFRTFDFASPDNHAAKRFETTVPQQALFQLNNPFVMEQADSVAAQLTQDNTRQPDETIRDLFIRILQREPTGKEVTAATSFLTTTTELIPTANDGVGWHYGWGELRNDRTKLARYEPLPTFHENRWGGSDKLPDEKLGWCSLNRDGGHTGHDLRHCPVRRWIADRDCSIKIHSILKHSTDQGDGVHGHLLFQDRSLATTHVHNSSGSLSAKSVAVKAGDSVDFVADCGANESHDSFTWKIRIEQSVDGRPVRTWDSSAEFSSEAATSRLGAVAQLAQTLMLANEFMFVD